MQKRIRFVQGNEACVEGALYAGVSFYAGYPITPSTEIAELLSERLPARGGKFIQMEDEIASMCAIVGASLTGRKVMTATSGPGFSLKLENLGYAAAAEVPCVIIDVMRGGPSTVGKLPFLMIGGDGDLEYYGKDNIAVDKYGEPLPMFGRYGTAAGKVIEMASPVSWPADVKPMPAKDVERHVLANAGARPWDRDADDLRVLFFIVEGRGEIINDEKDVSEYPKQKETRAPFVEAEWDLSTMTPKSGRYPGQKGPIQEHLSATDLDVRK